MGKPSPLLQRPGKAEVLAGAPALGSPRPPWEIKASTAATASPLARKYAPTPGGHCKPAAEKLKPTIRCIDGIPTWDRMNTGSVSMRICNGRADVQGLAFQVVTVIRSSGLGCHKGVTRLGHGVPQGCHWGCYNNETAKSSKPHTCCSYPVLNFGDARLVAISTLFLLCSASCYQARVRAKPGRT